MGRGIGYVDAHLLAAVTLGGVAKIWTQDKRLQTVAKVDPSVQTILHRV